MSPDAAAGSCVIGESVCNLDLSRRGPSTNSLFPPLHLPLLSLYLHVSFQFFRSFSSFSEPLAVPAFCSTTALSSFAFSALALAITSAAFYDPWKMQRDILRLRISIHMREWLPIYVYVCARAHARELPGLFLKNFRDSLIKSHGLSYLVA